MKRVLSWTDRYDATILQSALVSVERVWQKQIRSTWQTKLRRENWRSSQLPAAVLWCYRPKNTEMGFRINDVGKEKHTWQPSIAKCFPLEILCTVNKYSVFGM